MSNWLHISPTSGNGNTQMTISADTNDTTSFRRAKIVVTAGTMSKTIEVVQYPTQGDITCKYTVSSGSFSVVDLGSYFEKVVVYAENGNSVVYTGTGATQSIDYATILGVQEGDTITAQFYTTNHLLNTTWFNNLPQLKTLSINDGITGATAYTTFSMVYNCQNLETIHISGSMERFYSGETIAHHTPIEYWDWTISLVMNCPKLSAFTGDNTLIQDSRTLSRDGNLVGAALYGIEEYVVPSNITGVGACCFALPTGTSVQQTIKSIVIPDSVTAIHNTYIGTAQWSNFYNCASLTSVTMADTVVSATTPQMFYGCSSLTDVRVSSGLTYWGAEMFAGCSSLQKLTIPESVTGIGTSIYSWANSHSVFTGCTALTSITISNATQPSSTTETFQGIATGGTLYHPEGSDYNLWLSGSPYYLGYYL